MRIHFLPVAALALCSCFRNPATGKMQLDLLSESQEVELGKQAKQEAEQAYGIYKEKPELNQYIADIGKRLSAESGRASLPWSYEIVDDASVNAFALPGGPVFITRGILGHLNTEAELAAVLGHETGHVAARHSANQMSKQQVAQIGLGIGSILSPAVASAAGAASAGLQLLFLKYSRDDETQADELGFRYMTKVGYDPRQMVPLFEMLDGVSKAAGAGKTPEWLQTHPDPGNRLEATQQRKALVGEPFLRRLVAETERRPARLESHRRAEERGLVSRGLDQMELGARMLDPQGRQAELEEILAVDATGLLHDRVETAVAERNDAPIGVGHERVDDDHDVGARLGRQVGVAAEADTAVDVVTSPQGVRLEEAGNRRGCRHRRA